MHNGLGWGTNGKDPQSFEFLICQTFSDLFRDVFRLCPPEDYAPLIKITCHYTVNQSKKRHVRLGGVDNMHLLSWDAQTEKIPFPPVSQPPSAVKEHASLHSKS